VFAGEDVAELPCLLLEPGNGLRVGDLALAIRDLLRQRDIPGGEGAHLGVEVTALCNLPVHRECDQSTDPSNEHDCNPAQRDGAVEAWTWSGTDGAILFPAMCETNEAM
jgi:hypothetical protein